MKVERDDWKERKGRTERKGQLEGHHGKGTDWSTGERNARCEMRSARCETRKREGKRKRAFGDAGANRWYVRDDGRCEKDELHVVRFDDGLEKARQRAKAKARMNGRRASRRASRARKGGEKK